MVGDNSNSTRAVISSSWGMRIACAQKDLVTGSKDHIRHMLSMARLQLKAILFELQPHGVQQKTSSSCDSTRDYIYGWVSLKHNDSVKQ